MLNAVAWPWENEWSEVDMGATRRAKVFFCHGDEDDDDGGGGRQQQN